MYSLGPTQLRCQRYSMQGLAVCRCAGTSRFALAPWGRDGTSLTDLQAVAFGMGGGLLQRVNRDTMSFGEPCRVPVDDCRGCAVPAEGCIDGVPDTQEPGGAQNWPILAACIASAPALWYPADLQHCVL